MTFYSRTFVVVSAMFACLGVLSSNQTAQAKGGPKGGGGMSRAGAVARPSMGHAGGNRAGSISRPDFSRPTAASPGGRPAISTVAKRPPQKPAHLNRPSMGGVSLPTATRPPTRPGTGNLAATRPGSAPGGRPSTGKPGISDLGKVGVDRRPPQLNRPGMPSGGGTLGKFPGSGGGERPSLGNISLNRPGTRPGTFPDRPAVGDRPTTRPGQPGDRPSIGQRPIARPGKPGDRPSIGERPIARPGKPGDRPSIEERPIARPGKPGDRPGMGERPITRPGEPGYRPGIDDRPPFRPGRPGDRPGRPGDRPDFGDRPIIGGGNHWGDNIFIGGGNTIINTRPGWGAGRPGYGGWGYRPGGGAWNDYWYDRHIHHHHRHWYHGGWCVNWHTAWYAPFVFGATSWGVAATLPAWGYNYSYSYTYSNPYYVASSMPAYDYSQPIVINTYNVTAAAGDADASPEQTAPATQPPAQDEDSYRAFDAARDAFIKGDYARALTLDEQAIRTNAKDPVLHEFGALCLFAQGDYSRAAAVLNATLAVAPGMDWTTMSSLYADVDTYTDQLRKLEAHASDKPADAAARFVLAYHYLVIGHTDVAIEELKAVTERQPDDKVAQRMLAALQPPEETPPPPPVAATDSAKPAEAADEAGDEAGAGTDLIGTWRAEREGDTFELTVNEEAEFVWKVTPKSGQPVEISGPLVATKDTLVLESKDQGTMVAKVTSVNTDEFQFTISGAAPDDKGLTFKRSTPDS